MADQESNSFQLPVPITPITAHYLDSGQHRDISCECLQRTHSETNSSKSDAVDLSDCRISAGLISNKSWESYSSSGTGSVAPTQQMIVRSSTPDGAISWKSCIQGNTSYNDWVAVERSEAATKRSSMTNTDRSSNGMTIFNSPHFWSLSSSRHSSVTSDERSLYNHLIDATGDSSINMRVIRSAQSIRDDEHLFPAIPSSLNRQSSHRIPETQDIPRVYPKSVVDSMLNIALTSCLNGILDIQRDEMYRRCLPDTVTRHIDVINRYGESLERLEKTQHRGANTGTTPAIQLSDTSSYETFASDTITIFEPPRGWIEPGSDKSIQQASGCSEFHAAYGPCDCPLFQTRASPRIVMPHIVNANCYSSAGGVGVGETSEDEEMGCITAEAMAPLLVSKRKSKSGTTFGKICGWIYEGLLNFSKSLIVVPALEWDFQDERWVSVRSRRAPL